MQCNQCQFENMPGLARCFKCGSVLGETEPMDVNPPRMRPWKKPIRDIIRYIRGSGPNVSFSKPKWLQHVAADSFLSICFSAIPGLGHYLYYGTLSNVIWFLAGWVVLIALAIFMYGSGVAMFCLGLAMGVHAYIAISCYYLEQERAFLRRIVVMATLTAVFGVFYHFAGGWIFSDFSGQYSSMQLDSQAVKLGDFLLARGSLVKTDGLQSGDLVLAQVISLNNHGPFRPSEPLAVGQIIGRAGDVVSLEGGVFSLNGQELDKSRFPVPLWLQNVKISVTIPADSYFLSSEYTFTGNYGTLNNYVEQASVVGRERIKGKVFMRWLPLTRRGFIKGSS